MSDKMRRYTISFWILLILSVFHFALAAPVAVREMLEVRSNAEDVVKGAIATWEKRVKSNDEDMDRWSTNEAYRENKYNKPGEYSEPYDEPGGYIEDDMLGLEWSLNSEQMESDARGPDAYDIKSVDEDDSIYLEDDSDDNNGNGGHDGENGGKGGNDGNIGHDSDNGGNIDDDTDNSDNDGYSSGYDGDISDNDGDNGEPPDNDHSAYGSTGHMSQGRKSKHLATPELMTVEKILGSLGPRPRSSGSGAVGTPKEGAAGNR